METFFVSCPLGFEKELIQEIESFWFQLMDLDGLPTRIPFPEMVIQQGGIEFKSPVHLGFQVNFFTRLGLRTLLRLDHFEARYFDQFEKGLAKVKFEKHLDPQPINVLVESAQSRLFHEKNLLESASQVLTKKQFSYQKDAAFNVYIRIVKDKVTVSLDTSGEHLHFRGYRKHQGEAPLRENLASLMIQLARVDVYQKQILFDPYCGSGTFFFEAQLKGLPNFSRDYAFLKFKSTPAIFKSGTWQKNYRWINTQKKCLYVGIEKNAETYQKSLKNKTHFNENFHSAEIDLHHLDSENLSLDQMRSLLTKENSHLPVTVITNPPYGERSEAGSVVTSIERLELIDNVEAIAVLHPQNWKFRFKEMKQILQQPLSNQGLKTVVSVFKK